MTIELLSNQNGFNVYINTPDLPEGPVYSITITSEHSNTALFEASMIMLETNERYTAFTVASGDISDNHWNGIHNYTIESEIDSITTIIDEGVFKLITTPGGTTGTNAYVSPNENREADVYYRPNY
jgi:hypothetical protein